MTDADRRLLPAAMRKHGGFHLATRWYLRGWSPLPHQWAWHHIPVINTTLLGGIATGKTSIVAASNIIDCLTIPFFSALNTAITAKQAELPFDMFMTWYEGNDKLEHLVEKISLRPFPVIYFKNHSTYAFRTSGSDARFIRGSEYDRANFDEAGLDQRGEIPKVLRGRLRGERMDGYNSKRMARLDASGSPTDAIWWQERFYRGLKGHETANLDLYRSLRITTWENTHLTPEQIAGMEAEYPPDMIDVELGGEFPEYGVSMFPSVHVNACTDQSLYDAAYVALNPEEGSPEKGYKLDEDPRHGLVHFELPVQAGRLYVMGGDPGTDGYPRRNSPVVIVADMTEKPYKIVFFSWGSGKGSYMPFLTTYKYAIQKYSPALKGIDATGTQKALDELAFENVGIETDKLNFNTDKSAMLNSLSLDISNHNWSWPPIVGLKKQMNIYTLEDDKRGIPQDIVMTLAELSFLARYLPAAPEEIVGTKANYRNRRSRTTLNARRH